MTYFTFHLVFILPAIGVLTLSLPRSLYEFGGGRARWGVPLIALVAFVYTTPWDNYLVASEVWWYSPDRILATVGAVPVEEYAFFLLQPILTGLFCFQYLMRRNRTNTPTGTQPQGAWPAWIGFLFFAALTGLGAGIIANEYTSGLYLALILTWASPILAGMWLYDGETLWTHRRAISYGVGIPTLYLWVADWIAIHLDIWTISSQYTIGLTIFGLPLEEATFFLMTNLLVVQGLLLLLYASHETLSPSEHSGATASM